MTVGANQRHCHGVDKDGRRGPLFPRINGERGKLPLGATFTAFPTRNAACDGQVQFKLISAYAAPHLIVLSEYY